MGQQQTFANAAVTSEKCTTGDIFALFAHVSPNRLVARFS